MKKWIALLFVANSFLLADFNTSSFEFLAKNIEANEQNISAHGDVVIINEDNYIRANSAFYDTNSSELELRGGVEAIKGSYLHAKTEYMRANVKEKRATLTPFYLQDNTNYIWIASKKADFNISEYAFENSAISSCTINNPIWHIEVSEGNYNTESQWVNAWNPTFYMHKTPLFYLPYFGFSADQRRRSGVLNPTFGVSQDEGFVYHQPLYYAEEKDWDLEMTPQVRTLRGRGIYGVLRYADTQNSTVMLKSGYFGEDGTYKDKYNLRYGSHYGFDIKYKNSSFSRSLFGLDVNDGIYADGQYLNDIDYLTLQRGNVSISEDKISKSMLNYNMYDGKNYLGFYSRYYIDTSKLSNDSTLQEYPSLEYHRFLDTVFKDNIYYSINLQNRNYLRKEGLEARVNEINIPIGAHFSFFDDYLKSAYTQYINIAKIDYQSREYLLRGERDDARFARTFHKFELFSELVKPYGDYFHTVRFGSEYIKPGVKSNEGYFADFINLPSEREEAALFFKQFVYDGESGNLKLYHKLRQGVALSDYRDRYGEFQNEIGYYVNERFELSSKIFYSYDRARINETSNAVSYNDELYDLYLSYYQNRRKEGIESDFFAFGVDRKLSNATAFGRVGYDFYDNYTKFWELGIKNRRRCFGYKLGVKKEIVPILKNEGSGFREEHAIFFEFSFIPMGDVKHKFYSSKKGDI